MKMVSIITPVKEDDVQFLPDLLQMLTEQIYKGFEWLIIKDGKFPIELESDDITIRIYENKFKQGVAGARNTGIHFASGDYIYFLDSDDFITEHTLFCLNENVQNENADIVIGAFKRETKKFSMPNSYQALMERLIKKRHLEIVEAKPKQLRSSSLNIFFKKKLLEKYNILFDSELTLFLDIPFNFSAFSKANKIIYDQDAFYIKQTRLDPTLPNSLLQENESILLEQYPKAYKKAIEATGDKELKLLLENRLVNAYYSKYALGIYESDNESLIESWRSVFSMFSSETFKGKKKLAIVEIKALASGRNSLAKRIASFRNFVNKLQTARKNELQRKLFIYKNIFLKLPIKKNLIMYESFLGRSYSDSPKYIYQYLQGISKGTYKHVWSFDGTRSDLRFIKNKVKRLSLKYFYYLARTKYLVNNSRQPNWYDKREGQEFLQTWHGTPLKKLGVDIEEVHMPGTTTEQYKHNFVTEADRWDYLVSPNAYSSEIFRRAFAFGNKMLEHGYPRNDLLSLPNRDQLAIDIKKKLGIPLDKKIVLYAPTWRDDEFYGKGQYKFTLKLDLQRLRKELGDEYFFVLRTHYLIADQLDVSGVEDLVYNGSNYDDITELYLISDILITDYSSVFFDYANLKRPILFYAYDLDKYKDSLRGFYLNHKTEWPGPILRTNEEVIKTIKNIDDEYALYYERLEEFHERFCKWDNGNASKNICEEVILKKK